MKKLLLTFTSTAAPSFMVNALSVELTEPALELKCETPNKACVENVTLSVVDAPLNGMTVMPPRIEVLVKSAPLWVLKSALKSPVTPTRHDEPRRRDEPMKRVYSAARP